MFRRIRENLFGQPETPVEEEAQPDIDEQQEEAQDEAELVDSAPEAALAETSR